ncbi:MAG: hypothetical protein DMG70_25000 [Acidobacteria bacterium]|nr:MAG: hypothetical protein DMG70_25000 [Acidobacteriota bacterium]PYY07787.1 MAG: hypothetical protein DMG69_18520 [Acidobacteriota bacterium]
MPITVKRVYEKPVPADGTRVLVDRLWPRGLSKKNAAVDRWLRDLAPSHQLRKWFHANPDHWSAFRSRYLKELTGSEAAKALEDLYQLAHHGELTLLFASKNQERNNATVLRDLLEGARKPPTGCGPAVARAARIRNARRVPRR